MGEAAEMILDGLIDGETGEWTEESLPAESKKAEKRQRFEYALKRLRSAGFTPRVCSENNFHIKVGKWNFWAWTGKIYHPEITPKNDRGIENFIKALKK